MKKQKLNQGDTIITAYAQSAAGPGWSNTPLYVIVRDQNHNLREICLQPEEQTREMALLYGISQNIHYSLVGILSKYLNEKRR